MSGFDDGYNNLMRPGDGNWTAWRNGGAQRQHDQFMADMTARHHAAMSEPFGGADQSSPPPAFGGGYAGPMTAGEKKVWLILLAIVGGIVLVVLVMNAIGSAVSASRKADRLQRTVETQRATEAAWQPRLRQALASFDVQRDLDAVDRASQVSNCYRSVITQVMAGRQLGFVHCPRPMDFSAPFQASVDSDRFTVEYVLPGPTIQTRLNVMPVMAWSLRAREAGGREAPVRVAIEQLGAETVNAYAGRGCVAIVARRTASNRPVATEQGSRSAAEPAVYASLDRVTIACPSGGRLRVAATQVFQG